MECYQKSKYDCIGGAGMKRIVKPLCLWYQKNKRDLPWRKDPNPYHIWVSEIMLQQTRVEAVKLYYERFMNELPTIESLANVEIETLLKLWEGLGYYSRARNLKKAALIIIEEYQGIMPSTYEEILRLPGIGEYTAGAIASIAFQVKVPAIDGNVFRVIMRLQNSNRNISKLSTKKELFQELLEIMPANPGVFNQALMELGATICIPNGTPNCTLCPLQAYCKAYKENTMMELPIKDVKKEKKIEEYTVFIILNYDKVAIHKRPNKGLLASLYEFPNVNQKLSREEALEYFKKEGYEVLRILEEESSKHIFTHKIWEMQNFVVYVENCNEKLKWVKIDELEQYYALPSAFSTALQIFKEKVTKN